ncbi:helix-turn-helix transcriptional regulator [Candidatus Spongiisocius sp.]|uniref:helix-turn-helix transcriptional regulator n=1 Tax=Candidatus Spongiisocius sp. TaxID=3101273 RepID=UPI003B5B222E
MRNHTHNTRAGFIQRHPMTQHSRSRRIVRLPEVMEITGLSRTTIWRRERDGSFPPPIRLGGEHTRAMGWREQDIYDWIDGLSPQHERSG